MNRIALRSLSTAWRDLDVGLVHCRSLRAYPELGEAPFHPDIPFPEYDGPLASKSNPVYSAVRETLRMLGRDEPNFGTGRWNPFRGVIEPGMRVVVKPNLVCDRLVSSGAIEALFTNASVIRCVLDYVRLALRGDGAITLGDAPIQRTDWSNLLEVSSLGTVVRALNELRGPEIRLVDFRREVTKRDRLGMVVDREIRDAADFVEVDLGSASTLWPIIDDCRQFRVSKYDPTGLLRNHNRERNAYMIHRSVLESDALVQLPKLKTHKKAGISVGLKNLVGVVCGKDWLPHYRRGDAETARGDEYALHNKLRLAYGKVCESVETGPRWKRRLSAVVRKGLGGAMKLGGGTALMEGNWYGNDTTWRMVHDLNVIACFADQHGRMTDRIQRNVVYVVDGVIGGDEDSPLHPSARWAGTVIGALNPLALDMVAATVMGFDVARTPLLRDAWNAPCKWQIPPSGASRGDVRVNYCCGSEMKRLTLDELEARLNLRFRPFVGWQGHIERPPAKGDSVSAEVPRQHEGVES